MQSQVECSTAMVELCKLKQNKVDPSQSYVDASKVKQSHGKVVQSLVELSRTMVELCRVQQGEVVQWQSYVE